MTKRVGWSESEVRVAVAAYLKLLRSERGGTNVNKAALYRELAKTFPGRVPKAWELKFQNISAILYELRLPYCSGLKPRFNYQRLLRLIVLDALDRNPLPAVEPHEILAEKLRELSRRGPIDVPGKGAGRFGLALENALGIPQNSSKAADFMGIELKTKTDTSLQTLFSRTPSRYVQDGDKQAMFRRHSYPDDRRNRRALYTSFGSTPDPLGFRLVVVNQVVSVFRDNTVVMEYDAELLEEALLSKHSQTTFITLERTSTAGVEQCIVTGAQYCRWPSVIRFLSLVSNGEIYLDLTMSEDGQGRIKDHGFLWRIRNEAVPRLYLHTTVMEINR